jgi:hypothetical protein
MSLTCWWEGGGSGGNTSTVAPVAVPVMDHGSVGCLDPVSFRGDSDLGMWKETKCPLPETASSKSAQEAGSKDKAVMGVAHTWVQLLHFWDNLLQSMISHRMGTL